MSADYDRLFHSPDAVRTADEEPDRDISSVGRESAVLPGSGSSNEATPPPMPAAQPRTQTAQAPPSWQPES
ncbi:chromosome partitioning protein ParA, partial [Mycobacterium sp. ITM-2017-0098]